MKSILKAAAVCAAMTLAVPAVSTRAEAEESVRIVHGNPLMINAVFELYVPLAMGWWKDEGYNVEVVFSQGSAAAVQSMIGGSGVVGMMNSTPWLAADSKGLADIRMVATMRNTSWRILTMADKPIKAASELKGKTIGIAVAGSGGMMYLNGVLNKEGIDPQRDVRQAVIGLGAQSYEALKMGRVDASLTFMSEIANFKALGNEAAFFYDESWLDFPDYGLVATRQAMADNPKMVEALARGIAKAQVFAEANPECVAKIFRKNYGANRTLTLEQDTEIAKSNLAEVKIAFERAGGKLYANVSKEGLGKLQAFLLDNKLITQTVDTAKLVPEEPGFFEKINTFDHQAVVAQAKACAGF
ncbi:PhnD/SsuA/transferrin family substrate-binding protein [Rhizobium leguminosarum bv. viciae]|nr:PhnD/SsuA/transferrin family substrate-binding protein [Rhizobium leguminosarum bv. viciae]